MATLEQAALLRHAKPEFSFSKPSPFPDIIYGMEGGIYVHELEPRYHFQPRYAVVTIGCELLLGHACEMSESGWFAIGSYKLEKDNPEEGRVFTVWPIMKAALPTTAAYLSATPAAGQPGAPGPAQASPETSARATGSWSARFRPSTQTSLQS